LADTLHNLYIGFSVALAPQVPVRTEVTSYPLEDTARALEDLRAGRFTGAAVVVP